MSPFALIAFTLSGLVLFVILAGVVLTRFVPGPREEERKKFRWGTKQLYDFNARKWRTYLAVEEEE